VCVKLAPCAYVCTLRRITQDRRFAASREIFREGGLGEVFGEMAVVEHRPHSRFLAIKVELSPIKPRAELPPRGILKPNQPIGATASAPP
jgi:hypothetical protein